MSHKLKLEHGRLDLHVRKEARVDTFLPLVVSACGSNPRHRSAASPGPSAPGCSLRTDDGGREGGEKGSLWASAHILLRWLRGCEVLQPCTLHDTSVVELVQPEHQRASGMPKFAPQLVWGKSGVPRAQSLDLLGWNHPWLEHTHILHVLHLRLPGPAGVWGFLHLYLTEHLHGAHMVAVAWPS